MSKQNAKGFGNKKRKIIAQDLFKDGIKQIFGGIGSDQQTMPESLFDDLDFDISKDPDDILNDIELWDFLNPIDEKDLEIGQKNIVSY